MGIKEFYELHYLNDELLQKTGFNPYYVNIQSGLDDSLIIDNVKFINLATNNYLGIANDSRIKEATINAINKYGVSLCATPIASGGSELYTNLAKHLSEFIGLESSIIYPSCYQANIGLFPAIANKEDVIIVDQFSHSSLVEGVKAVGCKIRPYLHNNLDSIEKNLINSSNYKQIYVVTESVFSTEGSIAPFADIVKLCEKYGAIPVIDDSHGIGVIGKNGKGILEYAGIENYQGIYTASLGKSIANLGGVISGKKSFIDYLKYHSSHLIYSTAITPSILAGIEKAISIIEEEFEVLGNKMWAYRNKLRDALVKLEYNIVPSSAPITSIATGTSENTLLFAKKLYYKNILATPFIYPSVPENKGVIRLIAGANLEEQTIERAIQLFKEIKETEV
jgi:7-keto-8-aminopelargonate synthetase-like enzyme